MNASSIFRKVALDRVSSPEQIDRLLEVTPAQEWLALAGLLAILAAAIAWGFAGRLITKTTAQGVLIRVGGVQSVVALGGGQVLEVRANTGDELHPGDIVALVDQPQMIDRIHAAEARIRDLEGAQREEILARQNGSRLHVGAIEQQRASVERAIRDLEQQAKLAAEEKTVNQELLAKELITRQQVNATEQRLASIETSIQEKRAQISELDTERFQAGREGRNDEVLRANEIADAKRGLEALKLEYEQDSQIRTPYGGQVVELKVSPGSLVTPGTAILSLQPAVVRLEALAYVSASTAKSVKPGMRVEVSPANVRREEFGFIRGKVTFVSEYPATEAALQRVFENGSLVRALAGSGPVTEVQVELEPDPSTPSKFKWSSAKGAPIQLSSGTMITAEIVTREEAPVNVVIPYLLRTAGVR